MLWRNLRQLLSSSHTTAAARNAHNLLARAERETGLRVGDADLRSDFLRLIADVIVPLAMLEHLAELLSKQRARVHTVGRGWQRLDHANFTHLADDYADLMNCNPPPAPHVCVYAPVGDPLRPVVLHAAANGWPLLVCEPGAFNVSDGLKPVLMPEQHYQLLRDTLELPRALQSYVDVSPGVTRRAERAAHHVRASHTYAHRLGGLAQDLFGPGV